MAALRPSKLWGIARETSSWNILTSLPFKEFFNIPQGGGLRAGRGEWRRGESEVAELWRSNIH